MIKAVIRYHRSYRVLPGSVRGFFLQFLVTAVPLAAITILMYPLLTQYVAAIAAHLLTPLFFANTIKFGVHPYIEAIGAVHFLYTPGALPTPFVSLLNLLACLVILIGLQRLNFIKPVIIFLTMVASVHLVSSLWFCFFPYLFPYDASDYSQLYMVQQVGIWFFVPLIMGMAILPLPASFGTKCLVMIITYLYSLVFGTLRYTVFLFILAKASLLYMAILFFVFGPLIDFIYVVGLYSVYTTRLANKIAGDFTIWQWRYS